MKFLLSLLYSTILLANISYANEPQVSTVPQPQLILPGSMSKSSSVQEAKKEIMRNQQQEASQKKPNPTENQFNNFKNEVPKLPNIQNVKPNDKTFSPNKSASQPPSTNSNYQTTNATNTSDTSQISHPSINSTAAQTTNSSTVNDIKSSANVTTPNNQKQKNEPSPSNNGSKKNPPLNDKSTSNAKNLKTTPTKDQNTNAKNAQNNNTTPPITRKQKQDMIEKGWKSAKQHAKILSHKKPKKFNIAPISSSLSTENNLLKIATGPVGGGYYPLGGAICRIINRNRKSLNLFCEPEPTPGSVKNLKLLYDAEVDLAIVQSDWQEKAYKGKSVFDGQDKSFENMRFMFSLYDESLTMIVRKNSSIHNLDDIKGTSVNFGPHGSGTREMMELVMKTKGWNKQSFSTISSLKFMEQPYALCNGDLDVMVMVVGHPNKTVEEVSKTCEIRIINLAADTDIQKLLKKDHQYIQTIIPAGTYPGVPEDITTFGTKATLLTTADESDENVYKITKTVFEDLSYFKKLDPVLSNLTSSNMVSQGQIAPIHPGAVKYFREKGYIK